MFYDNWLNDFNVYYVLIEILLCYLITLLMHNASLIAMLSLVYFSQPSIDVEFLYVGMFFMHILYNCRMRRRKTFGHEASFLALV